MKKTIIAAAFLAVSPLVSAEVTGPIMLTLDGSQASEVVAWSWGASQSGSLHVGGGGGAGKANVQDISITRYTDSQSVDILRYLISNQQLGSVVLTRENLTITLEPVVVTSYSVGSGGETKRNQPQTENVTFNFGTVKTEIDGAEYCYNIAEASAC